jgi:hypothetical protein
MVDLLFARSTVETRDAALFGRKFPSDRRHADAARAVSQRSHDYGQPWAASVRREPQIEVFLL